MKRQLLAGALLLPLLASAMASGIQPQLKPFQRGSWQEILRLHAGRPMIAHFWGVTCGPCKAELPRFGKFMKDHPAIDVVTVSADLAPDVPGAAQSMLARSGLSPAENWIFNDG